MTKAEAKETRDFFDEVLAQYEKYHVMLLAERDELCARAEAAETEVERLRTQLTRIALSTDSREQGAIAAAALAVSRAALRQDGGSDE